MPQGVFEEHPTTASSAHSFRALDSASRNSLRMAQTSRLDWIVVACLTIPTAYDTSAAKARIA